MAQPPRYPSGQAFGIVGVNGGSAAASNPCLGPAPVPSRRLALDATQAGELSWAARSPGLPTQPGASFYVIAEDPGPSAASWPKAATGPQRCDGTWSAGCAYDYGYLRATSSFRETRLVAITDWLYHLPSVDPIGAPWWLDVETDARWAIAATPQSAGVNISAVAGFVDGLVASGVRPDHIGFYSTRYQWPRITGLDASTTRYFFSPIHPDWVPGAKTLDQARAACSPAKSFSGGHVTMTQYEAGDFDADYRCP